MAYVSFEELKARLKIEDVAKMLPLQLKEHNDQLRSPCPACKAGGDRALVITPSKAAFYCFNAKKGGDLISLYSHVMEVSAREAAIALDKHFGGIQGTGTSTTVPVVPSTSTVPGSPSALKPLESLTTDHELIGLLGLTAAACAAIGIGYCGKGLMRGRIALPLRLPDGTLVGYMGIATAEDQEPLLLFPKNLDERCTVPEQPKEEPKKAPSDLRKMFRVVA